MSDETLLGRVDELRILADLLDGVADRGSALILWGDPGIGKSTLLNVAVASARARGFRVLSTSGVPMEADLPFAGLHHLLRPLMDGVDRLPKPQRSAILSAFGVVEDVVPDLFLVALATLNLLSDLATPSPVLIIVEDADWLDRSTASVLGFVARRLESDPIIMLVALREWVGGLADAGLTDLQVHGLAREASAALLDARAPGLTPAMRRRVLEEAQGNPLALTELPLGLGARHVGDRASALHVLPLTQRLERSFAARISELPEVTRTLLLLVAALDGSDSSEVLTAARAMGQASAGIAALDPARSAGILEVSDESVRFRHPLMRSAVYQGAGDAQRRAAHAALASVLTDPDRRVAHLSAALVGPDEEVASQLEDAARRASRRGAVSVAAVWLERAARLTSDPILRRRRLLQAGELAFELGSRESVIRILEEVDQQDLEPLDRARVTLIREVVESGSTRNDKRLTTLVATAERTLDAGDADLALNLLVAAAVRCWRADPGADLRMRLVAVAERIPVSEEDPRLLQVLATAAPLERGTGIAERLRRLEPGTDSDPSAQRFLGMVATTMGDFVLGEAFFAAAVRALRAQGRLGLLAQALVLHAWTATQVLDWRVAGSEAEEGGRLALETGQPLLAAGAAATGAHLAAIRGDRAGLEAMAAESERLSTVGEASDILADLQLARGLGALGERRHEEAFDQLRRVFEPGDPAYHPIQRSWAIGDLVEAAVHSGHADDARARLDEVESLRLTMQSPRSMVSVRRARALLAGSDVAEALFEEAIDGDVRLWPFLGARAQLAFGEWLRRERRSIDARVHLRAARDTFDLLGALPWATRSRDELRAAGETSREPRPDSLERLTPQELQIARMASEGLSNREIGAQLYLSHRTVGFHLYRLYPKLGVRSRAELSGVLTRSPVDAGSL